MIKHALVDIGATLAYGNKKGLSTRLVEALDLDAAAKRTINHHILTTNYEDPSDLVRWFSVTFPTATGVGDAVHDLWDANHGEVTFIDDGIKLMDTLRDAGVEIHFASNIWFPFWTAFIGQCPEWWTCLKRHTLSHEIGHRKPSQHFFREALSWLHRDSPITPNEVVMIGDDYENDVEVPLEMGIRTIWIRHRPPKEEDPTIDILNGRRRAPHLTLKNAADLTVQHIHELGRRDLS